MKKVFVVYVEQEFDALRYSNKKWYKPLELEKYRETVGLNHSDKYILAQSEEEAIEKYKETKAKKPIAKATPNARIEAASPIVKTAHSENNVVVKVPSSRK